MKIGIKWIPFISGMAFVCGAVAVVHFAINGVLEINYSRIGMLISLKTAVLYTFLMALSGITNTVIFFQLGRSLILRSAK